jgi:hypothetical protein
VKRKISNVVVVVLALPPVPVLPVLPVVPVVAVLPVLLQVIDMPESMYGTDHRSIDVRSETIGDGLAQSFIPGTNVMASSSCIVEVRRGTPTVYGRMAPGFHQRKVVAAVLKGEYWW